MSCVSRNEFVEEDDSSLTENESKLIGTNTAFIANESNRLHHEIQGPEKKYINHSLFINHSAIILKQGQLVLP